MGFEIREWPKPLEYCIDEMPNLGIPDCSPLAHRCQSESNIVTVVTVGVLITHNQLTTNCQEHTQRKERCGNYSRTSDLARAHRLSTMSKKLFVGNVPPTCKPYELQALFERYGKVTECDILSDYGFVVSEPP